MKVLKIIFSIFIALVFTVNSVTSLFAAEENTLKEEVVYADLNEDGSIDSVYVVNIFELDQDSMVIDYGGYSSVRNMNTGDEISRVGETITIEAAKGKLYYQGTLENARLPWIFVMEYRLNGMEVDAADLAGENGFLEIAISIKQNPEINTVFFENYALQISVSLDSVKCQNIQADEATIANAGANKQISYIVLPGKETTLNISSDVTDFEMGGIQINGVPLSLSVDRPDTQAMTDPVNELQDGIEDLDDGAAEFNDAAVELQDAAGELVDGVTELDEHAGELADGIDELDSAAGKLERGSEKLSEGTTELKKGAKDYCTGMTEFSTGVAALTLGSQQVESGAQELYSGAVALQTAAGQVEYGAYSALTGAQGLSSGLSDLSGSSSELNGLAEELGNGLDDLSGGLDDLETGSDYFISQLTEMSESSDPTVAATAASILSEYQSTIHAGIVNLNSSLNDTGSSGMTMIEAYAALESGVGEYTGAVDDLYSGSQELLTGVSDLYDGAALLSDGVDNLVSGAGDLYAGALSVNSGMGELYTGAQTLEQAAEDLYNGADNLHDGCYELYRGTEEFHEGTTELSDGAVEFKDGTAELLDGVIEFSDAINELYDGTVELTDGTGELREKTATLDTDFEEKIDELMEDYTFDDFTPVSFVSEKNTEIKSVQFIIKTGDIEVEEPAKTRSEEETSGGFWQRFIDIFDVFKDKE